MNFWKMIGGKMLKEINTRVHTAEKGGKGLRALGKEKGLSFTWMAWIVDLK